MHNVAERVKRVIVEQLGIDPVRVCENANFITDLGADSLDTVEMIMAFEDEFSLEIHDCNSQDIATVGDAVRMVEKSALSYA